MKLLLATAICIVVPFTCSARPVKRASSNGRTSELIQQRTCELNMFPSDEMILNFALTLEHLENAFYAEGLAKFDETAFAAAGLPSFARGRIAQISQNEATHVETLKGILGADATQPCNYSLCVHHFSSS